MAWRRISTPKSFFDLLGRSREKRNLSASRRTLLARARQVLDETDPDPIDVHLAFANPSGLPVVGVVTCSAGRIGSRRIHALTRRGAYGFPFPTAPPAVVFDTWPPGRRLHAEVDRRWPVLPVAQWRVSKLGRPYFESVGDQWHDRNVRLDGKALRAPAVNGTAPLAALGRVARPPAPWTPPERMDLSRRVGGGRSGPMTRFPGGGVVHRPAITESPAPSGESRPHRVHPAAGVERPMKNFRLSGQPLWVVDSPMGHCQRRDAVA